MPASLAHLAGERGELITRPARQTQLEHADASKQRSIDCGKKSGLIFAGQRRRDQVMIWQAQGGEDRSISRRKLRRFNTLHSHPSQVLRFARVHGALIVEDSIDLKYDATDRYSNQSSTKMSSDAELFGEFTNQRSLGPLSGLNLAARKFP